MTPYPSDEVVMWWRVDGNFANPMSVDGMAAFVARQAIDWYIAQQSDKDLREFTKAAMTGLIAAGYEYIPSSAVRHARATLLSLKESGQ